MNINKSIHTNSSFVAVAVTAAVNGPLSGVTYLQAPSKKKKQSTMRRRKKRSDDDDDVLVPTAVISLAAPAPQLPEDPVAPEPGYSSGMLQQ